MGPGRIPWIMKATKIMAVDTLPGIPRVRSGMNDEVEAALLAVSGPATPSIAPLTETLRMFGYPFLKSIRGKRTYDGTPTWKRSNDTP